MNTIRNERGEVTTGVTGIQRISNIVRKYYEHLYAKKLDNWEEMDKFLEK